MSRRGNVQEAKSDEGEINHVLGEHLGKKEKCPGERSDTPRHFYLPIFFPKAATVFDVGSVAGKSYIWFTRLRERKAFKPFSWSPEPDAFSRQRRTFIVADKEDQEMTDSSQGKLQAAELHSEVNTMTGE
ncbi:hypothetical protein E2C01_092748 [Portunus trituberculatus]|uniref:Uncharacterized protein n=1 Tax=Portunus trituberculatus TaxID=210409 RepID=A0A5B7JSQ4_PORTR|nr:hypothetical protein [Portunus trituberculatus]